MRILHKSLFSQAAVPLLPLLILLLLFVRFQFDQPDPLAEFVPVQVSTEDWQIYFSHPEDPIAETFRGGADSALVESLDAAQFSIDMAVYHLDLWSVRDALMRAFRRGVTVRIVTESANANEAAVQQLIRSGIEVHEDHRPHLMHHKFVVVDRLEVWTGSMNLTLSGAYVNDNNFIQIVSRELAQNYLVEFEEMFSEGRFGGLSRQDTPNPVAWVNGVEIETYFSPDDGIGTRILEVLRDARSEVTFLAYTFTSDPLREALVELHQEGVKVRGVADRSQSQAVGSDVAELIEAGIDLRLSRTPGLMHHKVIVVDGELVILGSYNFTRSAEEKNDENMLFIHDSDLAAIMLLEFDRIYQSAQN